MRWTDLVWFTIVQSVVGTGVLPSDVCMNRWDNRMVFCSVSVAALVLCVVCLFVSMCSHMRVSVAALVLCVVCLFVSMCTHMRVSVHMCMCVYVGLQELSNFF